VDITDQRYINGASLNSPLAGKQFVVVGAGGAGRAIAVGAKSRGARVIIFDIDLGKNTVSLLCLKAAF
jgi:3-dehydroquinate dehydratase/shikimate dehydrogenase